MITAIKIAVKKNQTRLKSIPVALFLAFLTPCLSRGADAPPPPVTLKGVKLITLGEAGTSAFYKVASDLGADVVSDAKEIPAEPDLVIYSSHGDPFGKPPTQGIPQMTELLKKGGSIIFILKDRVDSIKPFEALLPVTSWSFESDRLLRLSTGATAPADSPLADSLKTPGFLIPGRFDLHLPYSALETGQHRYEWQKYGKDLLNTDWKVLLNSDQDGQLPILLESRCYAGRVFVFAGDLYANQLEGWAGYTAFMTKLLTYARPTAVPGDTDVSALTIVIPPVQTAGQLQLTVANSSGAAVRAVLAVKVRNLTRGLMNSFSKEISVPANQQISVPVPEADPLRADPSAPVSSDASSTFRRIDAGVAGLARQEVLTPVSGIVDITPAVTISIDGENVRSFPAVNSWPMGGADFFNGNGLPLSRYVYFCGEKPKITIKLGNGYHDIAPLASSADLGWPENPTTQGINDGCYSYEGLRDKLPLYGYWAGKSAETQKLQLTWPEPVAVAAERLVGQTDFRKWDQSNPTNYTVTGDDASKPLATVTDGQYTMSCRTDAFAPSVTSSCTLTITGLDPSVNHEPTPLRDSTLFPGISNNCALGEWEVYGWPTKTPPKAMTGKLTVTIHSLSEDKVDQVLQKDVILDPLTQNSVDLEIPSRAKFGQVLVTATFKPASGDSVTSELPFLFVPPDRLHLISRDDLAEAQQGYLCAPGFEALQPFGTGDNADSKGWGGPDDNAWVWQYDLMETGGDKRGVVGATKFFFSPVRFSHYTDPWRDFPSGQYVWDWATDRLIEDMTTGRDKGKKSLHIMFADRWNGIPIGAAFTWADFIRFDHYLHDKGKPGLEGKTRRELCDEIMTKYADEFQRFELNLYADELLKSQKRLADNGVAMTTETHGSFPLAGGEVGAKLAKTDVAVGTDLFWELRKEDLYGSLGSRFGLVAANPDLQSGAYTQWGWVSGTMANPTWFAPSGEVEPSRRQWYSAYWMGRVTTEGEFKPYTVYGFSGQGGFGVKNTFDDWSRYDRMQSTAIWLRPEQPTGVGIVASWQLQENRMGPIAGQMGFGLFTSKGYTQVDEDVGQVFARLIKNGIPISFVASTHTLKKWNGSQPLVAVNGFETDPWEIAEFDRLNKGGAAIIAIGSEGREGRTDAENFFGVKKIDTGWTASPGTKVINDASGQPFAFVRQTADRPPVLFCPVAVETIDGPQSLLLGNLCRQVMGHPITVSSGTATNSFLSNGSLFITLGNQGDTSGPIDVAVRPSFFDGNMSGQSFRVVDLDRSTVVASTWDKDTIRFKIPVASNDGRMVQIIPLSTP